MEENQQPTAAAPAAPAKKKTAPAKKAVAKKAAAPAKGAAKKAAAAPAKESKGAGRVSSYAGKKIYRLVKTDATKLRETGTIRAFWDSIKEGIKVDTWRESHGALSGAARKALADFIAKGYCEVR